MPLRHSARTPRADQRLAGALLLLGTLFAGASCEKPSEPYYAAPEAPSGAPALAPHATPLPSPSAHGPAHDAAHRATPGAAVPGARELSGRVLETYDSSAGAYTFARLALAEGGEAWVAGPQTPLVEGQLVLASGATMQKGFEARQRTFEEIWLAQSLTVDAATATISPTSGPAIRGAASIEPVAPAEGGLTIAAVLAGAKELAGRTVRVRGRVTRVTPMVGGTWVHLSDGSAEAARDDLTFILAEGEAELAPGTVATLEGRLSLDHEMARAHRTEAIVVESAKKL
jgi:hypothetical protein